MLETGLEYPFQKIYLVGLGSIGKKHLELSLKRSLRIVVVDPNPLAKNYVDHLPVAIKGRLELLNSLSEIKTNDEESLVVIANWGPDHFSTFKSFVNKGYRRFIIEKPLTSKISDLEELKGLIKSHNLIVRTNMPWNYSDFEKICREQMEKEELGPLLGITVTGGAKCLATIGIHHIGLAIQLFGSEPLSVSAKLHNSEINPRHKSLAYLEGVAFWQFSLERYLTISFSNQSHLQAFTVLTYKFGRILLEGEKATILKIGDLERSSIIKQVNTFIPNQFVTSLNPFVEESQEGGLSRVYSSILSDAPLGARDFGVVATSSLFGMLVSNAQKKSINLPMESSVSNQYQDFDWKIS